MSQPAALHPSWLAAVFVGGMAGTALRAGLAAWWPHATAGWPWATFIVNVTGSFALAVLISALARHSHNPDRQRLLRLGLGTGLIGSYTTYSSFAVEIAHAPLWLGVAYAAASVLAGLGAAALGLALVERRL